jgi:transposase-like protein
MSIEDEIWDEFNMFSGGDYRERKFDGINDLPSLIYEEKMSVIARLDDPSRLWTSPVDKKTDLLIESVIDGGVRWDDIVEKMPRRIVGEFHEAEFRLTVKRLLSIFETDQDAYEYIEFKRFGGHIRCPKCGGKTIYKLTENTKHQRYKCRHCNYKFSLLVRSMFQNTGLSLVKWYAAMACLMSGKKVSSVCLGHIIQTPQCTAYRIQKVIEKNITDPFFREINHGIFEYKPNRQCVTSSVKY